jgi:hypothetical protein
MLDHLHADDRIKALLRKVVSQVAEVEVGLLRKHGQ